MSSTEFQAVDLDAVLDAFESSQDLLQVVDDHDSEIINSTKDQEHSTPPPTSAKTDQQAVLKPNLLEDLNQDLNRELSLKVKRIKVMSCVFFFNYTF